MRKTQRVRPEETTPLLRTRALYGSLDIVFATSPLSESLGQTNTVLQATVEPLLTTISVQRPLFIPGGGGGGGDGHIWAM